MNNTAVIIARFQSPYLHEGHKDLINRVQSEHSKVVIVLGTTPVRGRKNPYDYFTRERMIKQAYPNIVILPLSDNPSDEEWSINLDNLLTGTFDNEAFTLYGSRDSFIPYYSGKSQTKELAEHGDYNATEIRNTYTDKVFSSEDFRAGIIYALYNQYEKVYPTVDVALFKNNRTEILLGKKEINNKWRFIGGYVDPTDPNYETAGIRELIEEAGDLTFGELQYEMSQQIKDWRYRSEPDNIITTLFSCDYESGEPKAQDDIIDVKWITLTEIKSLLEAGETSPEHDGLFKHILEKYNTK